MRPYQNKFYLSTHSSPLWMSVEMRGVKACTYLLSSLFPLSPSPHFFHPLLSSLPPGPHCLCMSTASSAQVQEDNLSTCLLIYHPSWTEDWLWTMLSLDMQWNHYLYYLALIHVFALSILWCQTLVSPLRLGNTGQNIGHTHALLWLFSTLLYYTLTFHLWYNDP